VADKFNIETMQT